jgi:hypothetical protein
MKNDNYYINRNGKVKGRWFGLKPCLLVPADYFMFFFVMGAFGSIVWFFGGIFLRSKGFI